MTSENDSKALIPTDLDSILDPNIKPNFSRLPHLQRLSGLVYVFLQAKSRFIEQGNKWFFATRENGSLDDLLKTPEFQGMWPLSETQKGAELPALISQKLQEIGNPFGFSPEATRAACEMADELASNQMGVDTVKNTPYISDGFEPQTLDYFQETMFQMLLFGRSIGPGRFYTRTFPANKYYDELFPPQVAQQIDKLMVRH